MRISDWSSDVCSSDLKPDYAKLSLAWPSAAHTPALVAARLGGGLQPRRIAFAFDIAHPFAPHGHQQGHPHRSHEQADHTHCLDAADQAEARGQDRELDLAAHQTPAPGCSVDETIRTETR